MSNVRPVDHVTPHLFPPSVEEWLPTVHLARSVVEIVDQPDLRGLASAYRLPASASPVFRKALAAHHDYGSDCE